MHRAVQFVLGFGVVVSVGAVGLGIAALWDRPKPSNPVHVASPLPMPAAEPVPRPKAKAVPMPVPVAKPTAAPVAEGAPYAPPPRPIVLRDVLDLYALYLDNAIRTDLEFKGKTVEFETVSHYGVGQSLAGGGYYLKTLPTDLTMLPAVRLDLADDEHSLKILADAPSGARFRVRGRVLGRIDFGPGPAGFTVIVKDCRILGVVGP